MSGCSLCGRFSYLEKHKVIGDMTLCKECIEGKTPKLIPMHDRMVVTEKYDDAIHNKLYCDSNVSRSLIVCGDCGGPTTLVITEIGVKTDHWHKHFNRVWGWCGNCDIG